MIELRNDRLVRNQPLTAASIKPLNDSCYVVPEKNPRVLQENTPVRSNAFTKALQRHEESIMKQKNFNEQMIKSHFSSIKKGEQEIEIEANERKQKQREFQEKLKQQMLENVSDEYF